MCSRYSLTAPPEAVRAYFATGNALEFPARYNIAPTQPVLIVRRTLSGEREQYLVRWGLIPSWVKDPRDFTTIINARSETAAEKPSFRGAMRHRRCLVPATGFYEWTGKPGAKQPHLFRPRDGGLIAMAGLAEHWVGADGSELETMAILTTSANTTMEPFHDRMPVIITPDHFDAWLDCTSGTSKFAESLLAPAPADLLEVVDVSRSLNNPRNEGPALHSAPDA
ncbi:MAG: DUF159 family protein [Hyphomicrobium sp. 32-62-53]|nr:MAG: DUF159 family protein [Hyphomicrobium sp. 12-62-95]OYY00282.1 MAG: DUF159 family protein [Hyphomicrobium sp. 32-62-53]